MSANMTLSCAPPTASKQPPYKSQATTPVSFVHYGSNMKSFILSEDRVVIVKKVQGQQLVIVKQKDSDVKFANFTPNR